MSEPKLDSSAPVAALHDDNNCPKCGATMEIIDVQVETLPLNEVHLCPSCYVVTWLDDTGFQVRQGVPVTKEFSSRATRRTESRGEPSFFYEKPSMLKQ